MARTPLYETLLASDARLGEYGGVETALVFNDVAAEFRELSSGCAIYDLGWRAKIAVSGRDRVRWLNGMVTNNIKDLKPGYGNYSFVLNPQGRIQGDLYTYNLGESFLIDTERAQLEHLLTSLRRFIIMDQVELRDRSEEMTAIGVQGPRATKVLETVGIPDPRLEPMQIVSVQWNGHDIFLTRMASDEFRTYEIWGTPSTVSELWKALLQAGAKPVGADALEKFRIMIGFPKYGSDIGERDLPQETEQTHALNFTKGCYIGQEIVERIRSRGAVHRKFHGFLLEGDLPERGTKLQADGKDVGELTSVGRIPTHNGDRSVALGYIRREALERQARITYSGGEAKPSPVPFSVTS